MRTRATTTFAALVTVLLLAPACSGGDDEQSGGTNGDASADVDDRPRIGDGDDEDDSRSPDASPPEREDVDESARDTTASSDTGAPEDTNRPDDTDPEEDGLSDDDTGLADTGTLDTIEADTATPDTGTSDSGSRDTMPSDGGSVDGSMSDGTSVDGGVPDGGPTGESNVRDIRSRAQSQGLQPGQSLAGTYDVDGVIVTAVEEGQNNDVRGVYVQEPNGPEANSGLWVFFSNAPSGTNIPLIQRGDVLDLEGQVLSYDNGGGSTKGGLLELHQISSVQVVQTSQPLPDPVVVNDPSTLTLNGSRAEELEGVLVRVDDVTVSDVTLENGEPKFGEVTLQSGFTVDEKFYDYFSTYQFKKGTTYSFVKGPLHFSYDSMKIAPRDSDDIDGPTQ